MQQRTITPLEAYLRRMGLRPKEFFAAATRVAAKLGLRRVSPTHLTRIRYGKQKPTEEKILLLTATLREMTGLAVPASELFLIEPADGLLSTAAMTGFFSALHGARRTRSIPSERALRAWGSRMDDQQLNGMTASERLEVLYREHAPLLRVAARRRHDIPPDDIDGLVNDVFLSFLERQPHVDDPRAYLIAAMNNSCLYYRRKRQHEAPLLPEHEATSDDSTAQRVDRWTLHLSLGKTLASLGPKCRETLRRYYLNDEQPKAIAAELDTTTGYVLQLLHTCRKRAREIYTKLTEAKG